MKNWPFALWGGDGSDDNDEDTDDDESDKDEPESLTMTPKELEARIARAASRATRKAKKDVRKGLGFDSQEDLDAYITTTREAQEATQTEADKLKLDTENERTSLASERNAVLEDKVQLSIERKIIYAGVTDEAIVKRIQTLVRAELGKDIDNETMTDDVADALEAVKGDVPTLFEASKKKNSGSGDGGGKDTKQTDEQKRNARLKKYEDEYKQKGLVVRTP